MKSLLFAAFALSLILMVSAQQSCNINAVTTCIQDYNTLIASATTTDEVERINRESCRSICATTTLPACSSLDPSLQATVNQIMQACSQLNGAPSAGYSIFALLSSIILAGVAAVFF